MISDYKAPIPWHRRGVPRALPCPGGWSRRRRDDRLIRRPEQLTQVGRPEEQRRRQGRRRATGFAAGRRSGQRDPAGRFGRRRLAERRRHRRAQLNSSQVVARLGGAYNLPVPFALPLLLPNGAYTQAANESNAFISGGQVTFSAACEAPRSVPAFLLIDNPADHAGEHCRCRPSRGFRQRSLDPPVHLQSGCPPRHPAPYRFSTGAPVNHQFFVYAQGNCNAGAGITLDSAGVDVIGERG